MNGPDNIIDLQPYLDAVKANEHREQMVDAIMAISVAKSNKSEEESGKTKWPGGAQWRNSATISPQFKQIGEEICPTK